MRYSLNGRISLERIELQRKMAVVDRILITFVCGLIFFQFIFREKAVELEGFILAVGLVFVEHMVLHFCKGKEDQGITVMTGVRYLQYLLFLNLYLANSKAVFPWESISMVGLLLAIICFYLSIDLYDVIKRVLCFLLLVIPMICMPVLRIWWKLEIEYDFLQIYSVFFFVFLILFLYSHIFYNYMEENNKKNHRLERQVEHMNSTNEALKEHQERINQSNELLGVQKIELQVANSQIRRVNSEMSFQNDVSRTIATSLDIEKVITFVVDALLHKMGLAACVIEIYPKVIGNTDTKYFMETLVKNESEKEFFRFLKKEKLSSLVNQEGCLLENTIEASKYPFIKNHFLGSMAILPIVRGEETIGMALFGHENYGYFKDNLSFYETITSQLLVAIDTTNLYRKMERMAVLDGLTGVYNRRYLTKFFNHAIVNCTTNNEIISVALFDIDHFKKINDTNGHACGDLVLKKVASLANQCAKLKRGIVGRYGGEEFVFIFINTPFTEVMQLVEKFHGIVKKQRFSYHDKEFSIDVSIGIASYPDRCKRPEELLGRADAAMYVSKENGRGRITIDSDEIYYKQEQ